MRLPVNIAKFLRTPSSNSCFYATEKASKHGYSMNNQGYYSIFKSMIKVKHVSKHKPIEIKLFIKTIVSLYSLSNMYGRGGVAMTCMKI